MVLSFLTGCVDAGTEDDVETSRLAASVTWTNVVKVSPIGNGLTKTDPAGKWNAGAVSTEALTGDGYVQFTTAEANTAKMCGLGNADSNQGHADIEFAIRLKAGGTVAVYESGTLRGNFGTYVSGDIFRVEVHSGAVTYRKNGVPFYTSPASPVLPLVVDTSLLTDGATIRDVTLTPTTLMWQNVVGLTISGGTLTKTGPAGWTAGASSVEALTGDGFVEFTSVENTTARMAGLGNGDSSTSYVEIDYAIFLKANGVFGVYENGVLRGKNFGMYSPGDRFRIEVTGNVVSFSKNGGAPFYTSTAAPTFPLQVDTSFNTRGATLHDVKLVDVADACPPYDGGGQVCAGSFTVANAFDLEALTSCGEITGNLVIQAPTLSSIALPKLARVGGDFSVSGSLYVERLLLPELKEVGGNVDLSLGVNTTEVDVSRLRSGNSIDVVGNDGVLRAPCLETLSGELRVIDRLSVYPASAYIPRLSSIGGNVRGKLTAPALETVGGDVSARLIAPVLTAVGGGISVDSLSAPSLTSVGGTLVYAPGMYLPLLARAGGLHVEAPSVDLPALSEITGLLSGRKSGSWGCDDSTWNRPPYELSMPALERVGSLLLCYSPSVLDLPQLRTVSGPPIEGQDVSAKTAIQVGPYIGYSEVVLPALEDVRGGVAIYPTSQFPVLTRIDGFLSVPHRPMMAPALQEVTRTTRLSDTLSADSLTTIGGRLVIDGEVVSVSLPTLTSVDSVEASGASSLSSLDLPALNTVTGSLGATYSGWIVIEQTQLSAVSLPVLAAFPGNLRIRNNASLTSLELPLLTSIGASLSVEGNSLLPNCYATDLLAQLQAAGWDGTWTIIDNGGGSCP